LFANNNVCLVRLLVVREISVIAIFWREMKLDRWVSGDGATGKWRNFCMYTKLLDWSSKKCWCIRKKFMDLIYIK
jgi:hypothetical protein